MKKVLLHWKSIYMVCCLVYLGWMIQVSQSEFNKINRQYRVLVNQLEQDRIRNVALDELAVECRSELWEQNTVKEDACSAWSPEVIEAKSNKVKERMEQARERGFLKVVLFYSSFVIFFLLIPPLFIFLFILGIIALCKNIKIVK